MLDLVERGFGYAVLTHDALYGNNAAPPLRAARIISPTITCHLAIATAAQRPLGSLAKHTIALIKSELAASQTERPAAPARRAAPAIRGKHRKAHA